MSDLKEMVLLDKAEQAIIQAKSIDEIKDIMDKAEVIRLYAKKAQKGLLIQNRAAEIKLMAERQAGVWLKKREKQAPGPKDKSNHVTYPPKLSELGVSKHESSRWQAVASLPDKEFKKHVAEVKESNHELTTVGVIKLARELSNKDRDINFKPSPIPTGLYNVIYADPPWKYEHSVSNSRAIENQYPTMDLKDICDIEVPSHKDSVLLLWATAPKLEEAIEVMNAWGFSYKTCAVWDKEVIGMGYYFRNQHELLLVGIKGDFSPPKENARFSSVHREKRVGHSVKPAYFHQIIEKMYPGLEYLELFSRKEKKGWKCWINN